MKTKGKKFEVDLGNGGTTFSIGKIEHDNGQCIPTLCIDANMFGHNLNGMELLFTPDRLRQLANFITSEANKFDEIYKNKRSDDKWGGLAWSKIRLFDDSIDPNVDLFKQIDLDNEKKVVERWTENYFLNEHGFDENNKKIISYALQYWININIENGIRKREDLDFIFSSLLFGIFKKYFEKGSTIKFDKEVKKQIFDFVKFLNVDYYEKINIFNEKAANMYTLENYDAEAEGLVLYMDSIDVDNFLIKNK